MEIIRDFSLGKQHKLKSYKTIKLLFSKGSYIFIHPFKLVYLMEQEGKNVPKVMFSVSKKNFKKSVDRHRLVRLMREAYRLDKEILNAAPHVKFLAIIFVSKELMDFFSIQKKLNIALKRLPHTFGDKVVSES